MIVFWMTQISKFLIKLNEEIHPNKRIFGILFHLLICLHWLAFCAYEWMKKKKTMQVETPITIFL